MTLTQDIKLKLSQLNVLEKIIVVNVIVFLLGLLLQLLQEATRQSSLMWFELPSEFSDFILKPWSIITYAFVHYDFLHILFNMLWLYVIGQLFLNLFSPKLALNVYFLGAISGGLLFILCYSLFPQVFLTGNRLVGASASVRALLIFICAYLPNKEIRFFTFNLKLWYFGLGIVILDVLGLFGNNAGGNLAHIGGAALGYFYAIQFKKGNDIGKGFERWMDAFVGFFKSSKKAF
jgi:membrane associated rhomboid family serine protease